jgi:hypothetical protein
MRTPNAIGLHVTRTADSASTRGRADDRTDDVWPFAGSGPP